MQFEKDSSTFSDPLFKTQIIQATTQVSQGILSTIVEHSTWFLYFVQLLCLKDPVAEIITFAFLSFYYLILITSGSTEGL